MKALVTGGAGFIGSHLCEALLQRGWLVTVLDNFDPFYDPNVKRQNLGQCSSQKHFRLMEGDICREEDVEAALAGEKPDVVVHLAARAGVRPSIEQPLLYERVNVGGTSVLLEAARRHNIARFVFGSSSSVYGNNQKVPFAESDPVDRPISPYAATKKAAELVCYTYHHLFGLNVTCLRLFTVYGARQRPDLAIHKFCRLIEGGQPIPVYGQGDTMRDYTYIDDVIDGVTAAIDRCEGYHLYNLGRSDPILLKDLIAEIEKALGKKAKIERLEPQPGDVSRTYADISLARAGLNYVPATDIGEGLAKFVRWFRDRRGKI